MKYIIITEVSVNIPGDERSKTNPGHGYPARTEIYNKIEYFDNIEDWKNEIKSLKNLYFPPKFTAGVFNEASIKTKTQVDVEVNFDS